MKWQLIAIIIQYVTLLQFVFSLDVSQVKINNIVNDTAEVYHGELLLTIGGIDHWACVNSNTLEYNPVVRLLCNAIGGGPVGQLQIPSKVAGPFVTLNPEGVLNCINTNVSNCVQSTSPTCLTGNILLLYCYKDDFTPSLTGPCLSTINAIVTVTASGEFILKSGAYEYRFCGTTEDSEIFGKIICRIMGFGQYKQAKFQSVTSPYIVQLKPECLTPCHNMSIIECVSFIPRCNLNNVYAFRCYSENAYPMSQIVDVCELQIQINKTLTEIISTGEAAMADITEFNTPLGNVYIGSMVWLTKDGTIYEICYVGATVTAIFMGRITCPAVGLTPPIDGLVVEDSLLGSPLSLFLNPSCLQNCMGKSINFTHCITGTGRCTTGKTYGHRCYGTIIYPDFNAYTCPKFDQGTIALVEETVVITLGNETWALCSTGKSPATDFEFGQRVCLAAGYIGVDYVYGKKTFTKMSIAGLGSSCLNIPNAPLATCAELPADCEKATFFSVHCTIPTTPTTPSVPAPFILPLDKLGNDVIFLLSSNLYYFGSIITDSSLFHNGDNAAITSIQDGICQLITDACKAINYTLANCNVDAYYSQPTVVNVSFVINAVDVFDATREIYGAKFWNSLQTLVQVFRTVNLKPINMTDYVPVNNNSISQPNANESSMVIVWADFNPFCEIGYMVVFEEVGVINASFSVQANCKMSILLTNLKTATSYNIAIVSYVLRHPSTTIISKKAGPFKTSGPGLSGGAIAGIVIAVVVGTLLIVFLILLIIYCTFKSFKTIVDYYCYCCCVVSKKTFLPEGSHEYI